jgi:hypothetical protein
MSAIDPSHPERSSGGAVERRPHEAIIAAANELYRACHLPVPSVVVAPSAPEFVRIVLALGQGWWGLSLSLLLLLIFCSVLALGLGWHALHEILDEGLTRSASIFLALTAYVSFSVAALAAYSMSMRRSSSVLAPEVMIGFAGPTALAGGLGFAFGGGAVAAAAAVLGSAAAALVYLLLASTAPARRRWAVRRAYRVAIPLRRARPLHDVLGARLRAAREGLPEASPVARRRDSARRERPEMVARLEAEGSRLDHLGWHAVRPLLGAGSRQTEAFLVQHAVERVHDTDDLPHVLRAAWLVHGLTDAATLLEGVAVVLPAGAPLEAVPRLQPAPLAWRRSRRSPYREVNAIVQNGPWPGLGIDVAWSDHLADRLLASCICKLRDAGLRHAAIRAMGMDRFIAARACGRSRGTTLANSFLWDRTWTLSPSSE